MDSLTVSPLLPVIQAATAPVILISGLGLLLLTMTNRMGRIIDRTRIYASHLRQAAPAERRNLEEQLEMTWRRAKIVRAALTLATSSMLSSSALVITVFAGATLHLDLSLLIIIFFLAAMVFLVGSLISFLRDIFVSLVALRIEVQQARNS